MGGRKTKSGLYRVTYTGEMPKEKPKFPDAGRPRFGSGVAEAARTTRIQLEAFHTKIGQPAVDAAWKELDHRDRFIQFAARTVLEHQDPKLWADRALAEKEPQKAILSLLALVRVSAPCPFHAKPDSPKPAPELRGKVLGQLNAIDLAKLTSAQKLDLARVYQVALHRLGAVTADERKEVLAKLGAAFPSGDRLLNGMILEILVYLQDDSVAPKALKLLRDAPTQEEQIEYARSLRMLKPGWTLPLRKEYFTWFVRAAGYKGGVSLGNSLKRIRTDAIATLTDDDKVALKDVLVDPATVKLPPEPPRPFVKAWKVADLTDALLPGLKSGRDYDRGRKLFATGKCFACHRFDNEGGSNAPDLTAVAGRFSPRDLLESILDPSKEISDQYAAVEIRTTDERVVIGRIVNLNNDDVMVNTDMLNPGATVTVNRKLIESMRPSKVSMMPTGLLDTFKEDEVLDLMAYVLSRGDRTSAMFKK
jgi:putative heme-binding domain-containing protein